MRYLAALLSSFTFLLMLSSAYAINIGSCQELNSPGYYRLINDVSTGSPDCMILRGQNITLDCQGHKITSSCGDGVLMFGPVFGGQYICAVNLTHPACVPSNYVVRNCDIHSSYAYGIWAYVGIIGGLIENNSINTTICPTHPTYSTMGIAVYNGRNFTIRNNSINVAHDLSLQVDSDYISIYNNRLSSGDVYISGQNLAIFNNIIGDYDFHFGNNVTLNTIKQLGMNIVGGPYLGGNYWSTNHNCTDSNIDGFCDNPFTIENVTPYTKNVTDYYPLTYYILPPEVSIFFNTWMIVTIIIIAIAIGFALFIGGDFLTIFLIVTSVLAFMCSIIGLYPKWVIVLTIVITGFIFMRFTLGILGIGGGDGD